MGDEKYVERGYRGVIEPAGLTCSSVILGESDLYVCTRGNLAARALESLARHRDELEAYLMRHPDFGTSFRPVPVDSRAPDIVREMAEASEAVGVGPMAAVAGAIAQHVGTDLLGESSEVIVENGGDIFLAGGGTRKVRVFSGAGFPPFDIVVVDAPEGVGVCTSSATVGPSVSLGAADAVTILGITATLADAAATATGNRVLRPGDIESGIEIASAIDGVEGVVIVLQGSMGAWGKLRIT
ncbi:MAG: UPF0280 family protein [Candidatus Geothermincolia bacterium]